MQTIISRDRMAAGPTTALLGWVCCTAVLLSWPVRTMLATPLTQAAAAANDENHRAVTETELRLYVGAVLGTAEQISRSYYRPVSVNQLVAGAMVALADAAGYPVPRELRQQPEKWLAEREPAAELIELRRQIGNPEAIRGRDVVISLQGMFRLLDPHSGFVTAEDRRSMTNLESLAFGSGIVLSERLGKGPFEIADVRLGSPAHRAGLLPGDKVIRVNGEDTKNLTVAEVQARLVGDAERLTRKLTLLIQRRGAKEVQKLELACDVYTEETVLGYRRASDEAWDYWLEPRRRIGYVRLTEIRGDTSGQLQLVLAELQRSGLRGLVLDLRDCPGGVLTAAVRVADLFLAEGPICVVKYREGTFDPTGRPQPNQQQYTSTREGSFVEFPLLVLIGPQTRGGGELIAAAIQDNHRGILIGERTYGKASVQQTLSLLQPVGEYQEIKLTVGLFYRPSGRNMHRFWGDSEPTEWGVQPDRGYEIRLSPELHQKLHWARRERALRNPQAREVLPLEDLKEDPVLYAAMRYFQSR